MKEKREMKETRTGMELNMEEMNACGGTLHTALPAAKGILESARREAKQEGKSLREYVASLFQVNLLEKLTGYLAGFRNMWKGF